MMGGIREQSGLTITEVLISAVVFMIGFSLMIALLNATLTRLSILEVVLAGNVGEEIMAVTEALGDTTMLDSVVTRSNRRFLVRRQVIMSGNLAKVSVVVRREKGAKGLIHLYHEFRLPRKTPEGAS